LADNPEIKRQLKLKSTPFPCGQCLPCRINRRRIWTHRLILERLCHPFASFVTLTYDDAHLPPGGQLCKKDAQLFLKRLRYYLAPRKIRYYLCGEYGERFGRPHYHAILFNVHPELDAQAVCRAWSGYVRNEVGLLEIMDIAEKKKKQIGNVVLGFDCSDDAIQYVAGYVTKKITKKNDGQVPEFSLMSKCPAIGVPFLDNVKRMLELPRYAKVFDATGGDVPLSLRHGSRCYPLGRTLRNRLRVLLDKESNCDRWLDSHGTEVLEALRAGERIDEHFSRIDEGRYRRIKARYKIYSNRTIE